MRFLFAKQGLSGEFITVLPKKEKPKRRAKRNPFTGPLSVTVSDTESLRRKLAEEFGKTERDIDAAQESLDRHYSKDIPAFRHWHYTEFGDLNGEKDALARRFDLFNEMRRRVEMDIFFNGSSVAQAFLKFEAWFEGGPDPEEKIRGDGSSGGPDFVFGKNEEHERDGDRRRPGVDEELDEIEDQFAEMLGMPPRRPSAGGMPSEGAARLKDLYRQLVRLLHPDANTRRTARQADLWHEVQEAYQEKDLARLEHLLGLATSAGGHPASKTSCWSLKQMIRGNQVILNGLKAEIREAKSQACWGFSAMKDRTKLRWRVERDLHGMISSLRQELGRLEDLIARWRATADRFRTKGGKRGSGRGRRAHQSDMEALW